MFCGSDFLIFPVNIYVYVYCCCTVLIEKICFAHSILPQFPVNDFMFFSILQLSIQRPLLFSQSVTQFRFHRIRSTFKRAKIYWNFYVQVCVIITHGSFSEGLCHFLKREDQRMLVLNQLLVSVCARSIHSGISINLIRGQLATTRNSTDSAENSLQIDNNLILFIHSKYYIKMGLFRLSTCQGASPAHLPLIIFIEFSPHVGFCFLSPYADFLCFSVGFYLHWSFLISFLMRNSSAI